MANEAEARATIPLFLPHLGKRIGQIKGTNLLCILKLQKLVSSMTSHVHQDVASIIGQESLAPWHVFTDPIRHQPYEILHCNLVPSIVNFDVVPVQVQRAVCVVVDGAGEGVARVACHIIGKHENDLGIGDSQTLDSAVQREDIGQVSIVEPEARSGDQDGPVGRVLCSSKSCHRKQEEQRPQNHLVVGGYVCTEHHHEVEVTLALGLYPKQSLQIIAPFH
jgi:hypothetical protein